MVYPLKIFDRDAKYYGSSDLNLYVSVVDAKAGQVDFTFYNDSLVNSSIARIYFDDDGYLSGLVGIEGSGVSFSQSARPGNLPAARLLDPPFETTGWFSVDADPAVPKSGINPGQWAKLTFDLTGGSTLSDVVGALEVGTLRAGVHIIALPDGSSDSAVTVSAPEPATLLLFGTAGVWVLTRKRRSIEENSANKSRLCF
jgi:hypothetical protein